MNLQMMMITCIVPVNRVFEVTTWLEDHGGDNFTVRPLRSLPAPVANGHAKTSGKQPQMKQGQWLRIYFTNNPGKLDGPKFREAWNKAGYKDSARLSALSNAIRYKHIKRVGNGYRAGQS